MENAKKRCHQYDIVNGTVFSSAPAIHALMVSYAAEHCSHGLKIPPFPLQAYLDHGYDERGNPLTESDMNALRTKQAVWIGCVSEFVRLNGDPGHTTGIIIPTDMDDEHDPWAHGWNACVKETKRLNSI